MTDHDLHETPATAIADAVRTGQLSAVEVLDHHLARIEKFNDGIGAFVFVDADRATAAARRVDAAVATGEDPGPLAGVPLGVKVTDSVAGWPETKACTAFSDAVAERDSTHVSRLLAAGAVPVGLTASPPMGLLAHTASVLYGVCRNPWDVTRTPGGSSGGSGAAVAAGLVPLATGSDMGGSIRNPASFCGVVGVKPTFGRIPRGPGYPGQSNLVHLGPLARTVTDAARYLDCAAGADEHDPTSSASPVPSFEAAVREPLRQGLRVAWVPELGGIRAEPEVEATVAAALDALVAAAGLVRDEVVPDVPVQGDGGTSALSALAFADRSPDNELQSKLGEIFTDLIQTPGAVPVVEMLAAGASSPDLDRLIDAQHLRYALNEAIADLFDTYDALVLPTMPFLPFPAEGPITTSLRGTEVGVGAVGAFTMPFNVTGHPSVSVPAGFVDGLPIGMQIVCRRHADHLALALAAALEAARPWPLVASRVLRVASLTSPAMKLETIAYEVRDGVAHLTLNRPDASNGVSLELARDLMEATFECSGDPSVRAVLLRGAGKNFCVGGDLKAFSGHADALPLHLKEVTTYLHAAVSRLARMNAPLVCAVQGSAAGAGMSLACGSDVLLVGRSARFVVAYSRVGLSPDGSASWFLPRLIGLRRALDLALTNRVLSADEAVDWGLATSVVDDDEIATTAERIASELAAGPTLALGSAKRLLRDSLDRSLETQMEMETLELCANAGRADGVEGITAFLEKRAPGFTGR